MIKRDPLTDPKQHKEGNVKWFMIDEENDMLYDNTTLPSAKLLFVHVPLNYLHSVSFQGSSFLTLIPCIYVSTPLALLLSL